LPHLAVRFRTERIATLFSFLAGLPAEGLARDPNAADRWCVPQAPSSASPVGAALDRYPDIPVDGISPQNSSPKHLPVL
jgi:hypothetical protein